MDHNSKEFKVMLPVKNVESENASILLMSYRTICSGYQLGERQGNILIKTETQKFCAKKIVITHTPEFQPEVSRSRISQFWASSQTRANI